MSKCRCVYDGSAELLLLLVFFLGGGGLGPAYLAVVGVEALDLSSSLHCAPLLFSLSSFLARLSFLQ